MRVTVDMEALEAFVAYAQELRDKYYGEFITSLGEHMNSDYEFDRLVEALDVSPGP